MRTPRNTPTAQDQPPTTDVRGPERSAPTPAAWPGVGTITHRIIYNRLATDLTVAALWAPAVGYNTIPLVIPAAHQPFYCTTAAPVLLHVTQALLACALVVQITAHKLNPSPPQPPLVGRAKIAVGFLAAASVPTVAVGAGGAALVGLGVGALGTWFRPAWWCWLVGLGMLTMATGCLALLW